MPSNLYATLLEFHKTHEPRLNKVLLSLQFVINELEKIDNGELAIRENGKSVRPFIFSMRLCGFMKMELRKIEIHDLWPVASFLLPFLRDFILVSARERNSL